MMRVIYINRMTYITEFCIILHLSSFGKTLNCSAQCRDIWGFSRDSPIALISSHRHHFLFNPPIHTISYSHSWLGKTVWFDAPLVGGG